MSIDTKEVILNKLGYWEVVNKPTASELTKYYADKYYQDSASSTYSQGYTEEELCSIVDKLEHRYAAILDTKPLKSLSSILDVGCGEGHGLSFFLEKGLAVKGLDFSEYGVAKHNPHCLENLKVGDVFTSLEDEKKLNNKYDIIWLQNVLEHVLEPEMLLRSMSKLVSDAGVLVVTVPNDFSELQLDALEQGLIPDKYWVAVPDHLSYFDKKSLCNIANETGWECQDILADFPIEWFLHNANSNYAKDRSLGKGAHNARIQLENAISKNETQDINAFYRALANIGMGRNIVAIFTPKTK